MVYICPRCKALVKACGGIGCPLCGYMTKRRVTTRIRTIKYPTHIETLSTEEDSKTQVNESDTV